MVRGEENHVRLQESVSVRDDDVLMGEGNLCLVLWEPDWLLVLELNSTFGQ